MVVAQLVEWSPPPPEIRSSSPSIGKIFLGLVLNRKVDNLENKRLGKLHFKTHLPSRKLRLRSPLNKPTNWLIRFFKYRFRCDKEVDLQEGEQGGDGDLGESTHSSVRSSDLKTKNHFKVKTDTVMLVSN